MRREVADLQNPAGRTLRTIVRKLSLVGQPARQLAHTACPLLKG